MATWEVEIRINSSVVVYIQADDLNDATKQAEEMCNELNFGDNVPEVDIAYPHTISPTWDRDD